MKSTSTFVASLAVVLAYYSSTLAAVIDFETTPGGAAPTDNASLNLPYNLAGGGTVAFFFDVNGNNAFNPGTDSLPVFEAYGPDGSDAFTNNALSTSDTANGSTADQLGNFFLRHAQPDSPPPPLLVDYNTSQIITGLTGEIWDIDGATGITEHWLVEVLDAAANVLATQSSPLGNSTALDGLPWTFSFASLPAGVDKVRITFDGSKFSGIGLAFNNFDPIVVPEPGTAALSLIAAVLPSRLRRRSR